MTDFPATLYHYTDAAGLLGILQDGEIWCSHARYLNDAQEVRIGLTLYSEVLENRLIEGQLSDLQRDVVRAALYRLKEYTELEDSTLNPHPIYSLGNSFVASFTTEVDDLAQWRAYSRPGSRYCIGFDLAKINSLSENSDFKLGEVDYDNEKLALNMRDDFVRKTEALFEKHKIDNYHPNMPLHWHPDELSRLNFAIARTGAPLVKHWSFRKESEWRIYSPPDRYDQIVRKGPVFFRSGQSFLVPYVKLELKNLPSPVVSITTGPNPNSADACAAVDHFVRFGKMKLASRDLKCKPSKIPYRDW
jgi:Protein of unknown function (DUF2971)